MSSAPLQRGFVGFTGPDADRAGDVGDEDLAVADAAGVRGLLDRFDDAVDDVVADDIAGAVVETIQAAAHTGSIGDGKIFVTDVASALRIRTGETNETAL